MEKQGDQANSVPIPKFNCSPIQFCNIGPIPWLLHNRGTIHTNQFNCSPKRHHHNTIQSKYNPESPCNPSDNRCTRGPGNRELGRSVGNSNHICLDQHQMQSDSWIPHVSNNPCSTPHTRQATFRPILMQSEIPMQFHRNSSTYGGPVKEQDRWPARAIASGQDCSSNTNTQTTTRTTPSNQGTKGSQESVWKRRTERSIIPHCDLIFIIIVTCWGHTKQNMVLCSKETKQHSLH